MGQRDITPERELHQPGPEEHPGEGGTYVDPARTRLKRRDPEGERIDDAHVPQESDPDEHHNDT
jgi:hypothetical protein